MPYLMCFSGLSLVSVTYLYPKDSGMRFCSKGISILTVITGAFTFVLGILTSIQKTVYPVPFQVLFQIHLVLCGIFFDIRLNREQRSITVFLEIASALCIVGSIVIFNCGVLDMYEFVAFPYVILYCVMAFLALPSEIRGKKRDIK